MKNLEIRQCMLVNGLKHWQVASEIGISPETLSRWMREDLTGDRKERVQAAVEILKKKAPGMDAGEQDTQQEVFE